MITNRLTRIAISSIFTHPCAVTDSLTYVILTVGVDILRDMMFDVGVDILTAIILVTDVDILAAENVNGLAAMMTPLEFTLSAP